MFKLNKFISLSLLGVLLITGCETINTFNEGKEFIKNINNNYESKFNEVTSFGVSINKYKLVSEEYNRDIDYINPT